MNSSVSSSRTVEPAEELVLPDVADGIYADLQSL
jgi:hypothetical protein